MSGPGLAGLAQRAWLSGPGLAGLAQRGGGDQVDGSGPPYQSSMMCLAIDTDGGSASSRASMAASSSSRLNQCASASSSWSTAMTWPAGAWARKPSIRLRGIGQGWLATYLTLVTLIP